MVIDLQITNNSLGKARKIFPDSNGEISHNLYYQDQLALIKEHLLNPTEVTFNVEDDNTKRKRLTTISSEISDISEDSVSSLSTVKKKIPDGGYGWIIVFASLMVSLIADGISFSFGLLYSELLDYFEEGTTKTAWIGSLFMSVPLISGPIMSNLVDKYGCQKMTMIGGILGCAGFVLSAFSNSVEMLYITFGVIAGVGLGVIYVTAVVSIAFWFEAKRTFATGIGASGTGIGTFLYAPFTQWLISYYGWRGATLILGGTLLNFCVFGALMIDPEWLVEENKLERSQSMQTFSNSSMCLDEIKKLIVTGAPKEDLLDTLVTNVNTEANQQIYDPDIIHAKKYQSELLLPTFISKNDIVNFDGLRPNSRLSLRQDQLISPITNSENELEEKSETTSLLNVTKNKEVTRIQCKIASIETLNTSEKASSTNRDIDMSSMNLAINQNEHILGDFHDEFYTCFRSGLHGSRFSLNDKIFTNHSSTDDIKNKVRGYSLNILYENHVCSPNFHSLLTPNQNYERDEELALKNNKRTKHSRKKRFSLGNTGNLKRNPSLRYSNYLKNMRVHRNSIHYRGAMLSTHRYRLKASSCPNIYRNSMTTIAREHNDVWYDDFVDIIKSVFDFSLFLQYKFGMMSLSTLFLFIWYIIPYFYITEYLLQFHYTEEASAYLISIIGIFNTFGMVVLGWVGDQQWCSVTKTYGCCLFVCGISMFAIPLATSSYTFLMTLCAIFGVTFGSSFSFTPMITSRLVDMDDFTLAYGLILLVQGIGSLVGPPLSGWIFDVTNRWDYSFYLGGIFVSISGVLAYIIGPLQVEIDEEGNSNNNAKDYQLKKPI